MVVSSRGVQVIAITSGKGGVGKTNTSVNLAVSLAAKGNKVLLLDADLGLANVDVLMGLFSEYNLSHVVRGEKKLSDIILNGPKGMKIIPSSSGVLKMARLKERETGLLIQAFSELEDEYDYLIVDTSAGISDTVLSFLQAAHHVVVIVCDEPSSMTDAYAMIKVLKKNYAVQKFWFLASMVDDICHGQRLYEKMNQVVERFLGGGLNYLDTIPYDPKLKQANKLQSPVVEASPSSVSAISYARAAKLIDQWAKPATPRGNMEFFVERLVQ